jgi:putative redox protein
MVEIDIEYLGDLECKAVHGPSGSQLITDTPADNQGRGEHFSPTDLLATAVGTCVGTVMGIVADRHGIDIKGLKISVSKEIHPEPPRRVGKLTLNVVFPHEISGSDLKVLSAVVDSCPVTKSLNPEIVIEKNFSFGR